MRNPINHEEIYFEFVKNHDQLKHIIYSDNVIENQKIIGVLNKSSDEFLLEELKAGGVCIINPDFDCFYNDFINLDHDLETIEYIKDKIENFSREELVEYTIQHIKKIISLNIFAEKIYIVVYQDWPTDWLEEVIEV